MTCDTCGQVGQADGGGGPMTIYELIDAARDAHKARVAASETRLKKTEAKLSPNDCTHPKYTTYMLDRDNGYGRWWKHETRVCSYCKAERNYGTWGRAK